ncbi:hypothetical protein ACFFJQ_18390 [Bacillus capparidis]|uniref:Uncharacterized protein n=1 Tax=Bacillus capparidis TaxID=1840411 RepID=A0ABS4CZW7_9BACI|nr:hypothetical protein [Bacillus capparidis]MBP1082868.1 hypothetical protein [Bacillus capparidis]
MDSLCTILPIYERSCTVMRDLVPLCAIFPIYERSCTVMRDLVPLCAIFPIYERSWARYARSFRFMSDLGLVMRDLSDL